MPSLLERLAGTAARWHALHLHRRFLHSLKDLQRSQDGALQLALSAIAGSEFAAAHGLRTGMTQAEFRRALPLQTYENLRPWIDRVADSQTTALFAAGTRVHMFATSSGTTARRKLIPVTEPFVREYRRGWNTFGVKMLSDHAQCFLRPILQSTGRMDESHSAAGIPCGAITGLLARTQKGIVRRFYVGRPEIANVREPRGRYYLLARFGIERDVSFAITANPGTLVRIAQTADEESESLIRDVRDGRISAAVVGDDAICATLAQGLRPNPTRAAELERLRGKHARLRPADYWKLGFVACWTGGSMSHHLQRLRDWWGNLPIRDIGLLASEGRVTIPLTDESPAGPLDVQSSFFEFIPVEAAEEPQPETVCAGQLETGREYVVVLTNTAGLIRYRLDDVVRCTGWEQQCPVVEFLYRAGRVSSLAGEKLTENQVVAAIRDAVRALGAAEFDFVLAPCLGDPPCYRLNAALPDDSRLLAAIDAALGAQNEEYAGRRASGRLGALQLRTLAGTAIREMDQRLIASRGGTAEQYKRPCLLLLPSQDEEWLPAESIQLAR